MRTLLFINLLLVASQCWANLSFTTRASDEINIVVHAARGDDLFIWLPSEAGPQNSEQVTARQLSHKGIEVWQVNLLEDYFLPIVPSSLDRLPEEAISELIDFAIKQTRKNIYLVTSGRGVIPFLRGARQWQLHHPGSTALAGTILLSPKFFVETPDPGVQAQLMPIVTTTNLPIFIIQPEKSPWYWKLDRTIPALQQGGSDIYTRRLANVRDRFFFRPDATNYEKQVAKTLPVLLAQALKLLKPYQQTQRRAVKNKQENPQVKIGKKDRILQPFLGNPAPPLLQLANLEDKVIDLADMNGQVVLVNFWASWCPPCVHEMPSMQRLQNQFSDKPFTIIGVNMAEDRETITSFLKTRVNVNFPILLDSDGAALKRWGVFAFPTSYVIDKKGQIRYALFGGLEWDTPDIIEKISNLLNE